eukprot:364165-Chlamydomonas_euryale.AAC.17
MQQAGGLLASYTKTPVLNVTLPLLISIAPAAWGMNGLDAYEGTREWPRRSRGDLRGFPYAFGTAFLERPDAFWSALTLFGAP